VRHDQEHDADACAFCRERLPDYAAGHLQGDGRLFVERHLRTCVRCSSELRQWEAIKQVVRATDGMPQPQRAFADTWSELRAQLSPVDIALDRSQNGRVLMEKTTSPGTDEPATRPDTSVLPRTRLEEPTPRRGPSGKRFRGFAATAAMVATVAALIAVLITLAPGHRSGATVGGRTTSTATNNERGRWVDLTALDYKPAFDANDVPAIAPTNPSVVYETQAANEQTHTAATMRRTDDSGKTWHALPLPVAADHVGHLGVAVSPLNAHTVFLSVFDDNAGDCPANRTQQNTEAGNGNVYCWLQYTSVDGGQHWATTNLPLTNGTQAGMLTATNSAGGLSGIFAASLHVMGDKLYAGFTCVISSCMRLVTSTDGGLTWQFADEQIIPQGGSTCDYAASADGATLFVVTAKDCGNFRNAATQLTLWRSTDAGAHWTQAETLPTPNARGMFLTKDTASGKQLLYAALPRTTGTSPDKMGGKYFTFSADATDLKVSTDGGETWESAPSAGIPAGMRAANYGTGMVGMLGTLHDGSVVVEFIAGSVQDPFAGGTLFAWKRGDTKWRQIAPPLTQEIGSMLAIPAKDASQQDTLYLVMVNRGGSGDTDDTFRFLRYVP
jgi:anti-sigma factor RsiW